MRSFRFFLPNCRFMSFIAGTDLPYYCNVMGSYFPCNSLIVQWTYKVPSKSC